MNCRFCLWWIKKDLHQDSWSWRYLYSYVLLWFNLSLYWVPSWRVLILNASENIWASTRKGREDFDTNFSYFVPCVCCKSSAPSSYYYYYYCYCSYIVFKFTARQTQIVKFSEVIRKMHYFTLWSHCFSFESRFCWHE